MSQRDEAMQIVKGISNQKVTQLYEHECYGIADALAAAGLLVHPDESATKSRGTWEEGYEVGYQEGGASATEDWQLVIDDLQVVPPSMTAEKLREIAQYVDRTMSEYDTSDFAANDAVADLLAAANFLDTKETES